jgi:hypothetical protein
MEADVVAGGHVFHAEVAAVSASEVRFNLIAEVQADPALPVTLTLSMYKFDRMEWALEKATELGVFGGGACNCAANREASGASRGETHRAMASHCA